MESTRTQTALSSTDQYELIIDTREDRTVYEIWTADLSRRRIAIIVHQPAGYGEHTIAPYLGYETTNIQTTELAAAFAEAFTIATYDFKAVEDAWKERV